MPDRLEVVDLRKSFAAPNGERIDVLRGLSFEIRPGECVAVTGASGSGKSTLLQLLGGLEDPDHGSLTAFRREQIGFVFQFHYLLPDLSALENVALPLSIRRSRNASQRARDLLGQTGLTDRKNACGPPSNLAARPSTNAAPAMAPHAAAVTPWTNAPTERFPATRR